MRPVSVLGMTKIIVIGFILGVAGFVVCMLLFLELRLNPMMVFAPGFAVQRFLEMIGLDVTNRVAVFWTLVSWCLAMTLLTGWYHLRRKHAA